MYLVRYSKFSNPISAQIISPIFLFLLVLISWFQIFASYLDNLIALRSFWLLFLLSLFRYSDNSIDLMYCIGTFLFFYFRAFVVVLFLSFHFIYFIITFPSFFHSYLTQFTSSFLTPHPLMVFTLFVSVSFKHSLAIFLPVSCCLIL